MSRPDGVNGRPGGILADEESNDSSSRRQLMTDPVTTFPVRTRSNSRNVVREIKVVRPVCPVPKPGRCLICAGRKICHYN